MVVFLHVAIALASVGVTTLSFFQPSTLKLRISYALIAATLASGTYLVVEQPAHMLQACMTGFVYVLIVSVGTVMANVRLARLEKEMDA